MGGPRSEPQEDPGVVEELARLFREHPAWREAAGYVTVPEATSDVYFSHRPGEVWHLELRGDRAALLPGASPDPDFVFRFTPQAIRRLCEVHDGIAGFALALFEGMTADDPVRRVDFRLAASFPRLLRRGYLRLLLAGGPRVLAFGARRGVRSLRDLRELVKASTRREPADWEIRPD